MGVIESHGHLDEPAQDFLAVGIGAEEFVEEVANICPALAAYQGIGPFEAVAQLTLAYQGSGLVSCGLLSFLRHVRPIRLGISER